MDGFRESQKPRAEEAEGSYAGLEVPGHQAPAAHVLRAREVPGLLTPRPGRTSDVLYSCGRPRPLWGLALPWGSRPTLGASRETMPGALAAAAAPAAGLERREGPPRVAGRRARPPVSASASSQGWAAFTWPCRVREAWAGQGFRGPRRAHQGVGWDCGVGGAALRPGSTGRYGKVASASLQSRELVTNTLKPKNLCVFWH